MDLKAVVGGIGGSGENKYFFAFPVNSESLPTSTAITCSIGDWDGSILPRKGQVVFLVNVQEFIKGWRAQSAHSTVLTPETRNKEV